MSQPVGGLLPQSTYEICPEISADQRKWSSGASVKVATLALPSPHPAVPVPPKRFDTNYPDTTGFESVTVARDCHDFMARMSTAMREQLERGTIINIPAGTVCTANYSLSQPAADLVRFAKSAVNVGNNSIELPRHGYAEGQGIIFGTWYGCLPGSNGAPNCNKEGTGSLTPGELYYAHVIDANTIQVYKGAPKAAGGTMCKFATPGNGQGLVVKWPRPLHWIVVRTATLDAEFDPEHVRVSPAWAPKMAVLRAPINYLGPHNSNILFNVGDQDGGLMSMNAQIRFVGIEFTYTPSPEAPLTSDPAPHFEFVRTNRFNQNIVFDRCYFHGLTKPERTARAFLWDGMDEAIVDSYIDGLEFYHPTYTGLGIAKTSPTSFTIAPGSYSWGSGSAKLDRKVTVEMKGDSGTAAKQVFVYYSIPGQLQVALPPGVSGTCSPGPCHLFTGSDEGDSLYTPSSRLPNKSTAHNYTGHNYWIDPIFSSTSSCAQKTSLFASVKSPTGGFDPAGAAEIGLAFTSDTNGYVCGVRYYRDPAEKGAHGAAVLTADGKQLARTAFSNETAYGWQEASFPTALQVTAGVKYVATMNVNNGAFTSAKFFQNGTVDSGHLHTFAQYAASNGSCNYTDAWPKDFVGNTAAAQVGCITLQDGQITKIANADAYDNEYNTEGCQCMVGGVGPGPYAFINNYVEASGNVWHHDDSGGFWATRSDYYYLRNRFHAPLSEMFGGPESDGLRYGQRQLMEWKAGYRILLEGNVFDGGWVENTPFGEFIDFSSVSGNGIRDVDLKNNTFQHGATVLFSPSSITGGVPKPAPPIRFRFENNLVWDIVGSKYCTHGQAFCPQDGGYGVVLAGSQGAEDWIVDHNTIVGNIGTAASLLWISETRVEGFKATNNVLYLSPVFGEGISAEVIGPKNRNCKLLYGEAAADCALEGYVFENNILTGTASRADIRSWWPHSSNYVPAAPSDLSKLGKVVRDPYSGFDEYRVNPAFCADCRNAADELKHAGINQAELDSAQGKVESADVPEKGLTATSAEVVFTAPDKQACPVDYSKSDPTVIASFTRANDAGSTRERKIVVSGLNPGTVYHYRINCAVEQPTGSFKTR